MNDRDTIVIMEDEYNIEDTEEVVEAAGVVIDGPLKLVMDKILKSNDEFEGYSDLIKEALYVGLIEIINKEINPKYRHPKNINNIPEGFDETEYEEIPFEEFEALTKKYK